MFALANPWFLVGLAGVGLPVLIHMLTRARPRVIRYPTYRLLVEAGSGKQSLDRLRTWIILLLRTLAVAALVMAFARPFLQAPGAEAAPGQARRVVLVVDASLSMRAGEGGVPLFTRAKARAADVLRGLDPGSQAAVVFAGATPRAALPALSRNLAVLHQGLADAEATLEKGDPPAALALADRLLDGHGDVYVFSDFQRTDWAATRFDRWPGLSVFLDPATERPPRNVGLVDVRLSPPEPVEGETVELACKVFNATAERRQQTVHLDLEGVTRQAPVELMPFGSATAVFSFSLPRAGVYPGRVTLDADNLAEDDVRYFKAQVRHALKVLLVSDTDPDDTASAAFFIQKALRPSAYVATGMRVVRRHSQEVDRTSLETADCFILASPVHLAGETLEVIARRVAEGAHLACFLDGPDARLTVNGLAGSSRGDVAPPFQLLRAVASRHPTGDPFAPPAGAPSEALKLFASADSGDLTALRFARHYLTQVDPARASEVLLRFGDGSAALALSPADRGTALWANFSPAPGLSNIAGSPLFPALLHELLRALRTAGAEPPNTPGRPWHIDVPAPTDGKGEPELTVLAPDGRAVEATVIARGRTVRLAVPPANRTGHYPVRDADRQLTVGVVNVDPRETDTRTLNIADLLDPAAGRAARVAVIQGDRHLVTAGTATPLWPHLLAAAVALFATEMLLLGLWRRTPSRRVAPRVEGGTA